MPFPEVVDGIRQTPLAGVSMRYSFESADAPTRKQTQYYEMLSTRGLWHEGWKVSTEHGPMIDTGKFEQDRWQFFHVQTDRAEARDLAAQYPEKVKELAALWMEEALRNDVLPLDDYGVVGIHSIEYKLAPPASGRYVYYPDTTEVPEASAARTLGNSFKIIAEVDLQAGAQGVIASQGSRFGGYSLYIKDGELRFVYNFLGIPPEQQLVGPLPAPGKHLLGVGFEKREIDAQHAALGKMTLYINDVPIASADFRTQTGHYALAGEGLAIGYDSGDPVTRDYDYGFRFQGGRIYRVVYDIADDGYVDLERKFAARLARD